MHNHCIHVYVLFSTHSISTYYTYPIFFLYSFFILCSFPIFFFFIHFHPGLFFVLLYSFSTRPFLCSFVFNFIPFLFFVLLYLFSSISFNLSSCIDFHPFLFLFPLFFNSIAIFLLRLICAQIYPHSILFLSFILLIAEFLVLPLLLLSGTFIFCLFY